MEHKRKGDEYTTTDHNRFVDAHKRAKITAAQGSGITVNDTPSGVSLGLAADVTFKPVPVKCTAEDTPSAGLHTFKECDLDGAILTGDDEVVYTSCRLLGDEDGDWEVSVEEGEETFGMLYKYKGENVVILPPSFGNAYYYA